MRNRHPAVVMEIGDTISLHAGSLIYEETPAFQRPGNFCIRSGDPRSLFLIFVATFFRIIRIVGESQKNTTCDSRHESISAGRRNYLAGKSQKR